jgi:hypothetical protein
MVCLYWNWSLLYNPPKLTMNGCYHAIAEKETCLCSWWRSLTQMRRIFEYHAYVLPTNQLLEYNLHRWYEWKMIERSVPCQMCHMTHPYLPFYCTFDNGSLSWRYYCASLMIVDLNVVHHTMLVRSTLFFFTLLLLSLNIFPFPWTSHEYISHAWQLLHPSLKRFLVGHTKYWPNK